MVDPKYKDSYQENAVGLALKLALDPEKNADRTEKRTWVRIAFILASELERLRKGNNG